MLTRSLTLYVTLKGLLYNYTNLSKPDLKWFTVLNTWQRARKSELEIRWLTEAISAVRTRKGMFSDSMASITIGKMFIFRALKFEMK